MCQLPHSQTNRFGGNGRIVGSYLEGLGQKRIAREERICLTVRLMAGRFTAAKIAVIHTGHIIVDQGIGVDHLHSTGKRQRSRIRATKHTAEVDSQKTADTLTAAHGGIAHSLGQHGITGIHGGKPGIQGKLRHLRGGIQFIVNGQHL